MGTLKSILSKESSKQWTNSDLLTIAASNDQYKSKVKTRPLLIQ